MAEYHLHGTARERSDVMSGDEGENESRSRPSPEPEPPSTGRLSVAVMDAESLAPIFFTALFLSVILALGYVLSSFLADAVISFILLGLFQKPYRYFLRRVNNRWVASGITTSIVVFVLLMPFFGFLYAVTVEATLAFEKLSYLFDDGGKNLIEETVAWAKRGGFVVTTEVATDYIEQLAQGLNALVVAFGSAVFGNVLSFTIHAAIEIVMIFYLFADGDRLREFLFKLSPLPDNEDAMLVETFQKVSRGVVVGNGLGSAIQGLLGGLAMWIVGLPSPLLWGAVMTVFAFLPLVGITIVVIPAALVLLLQGEPGKALGFLAFCMLMGTFVDNVVKTKLMGSAMRMHDLLVFLSIIGGLTAFGVIGFIYGPLIAMLFMTLHGLYETHYLPQLARRLGGRNSLAFLARDRTTQLEGSPPE